MEAWSGNEKWHDNENKRKGKGTEHHECMTEKRERHGTQRRKERLSGN